jgi:uncharacterized protein (DUF58 family)
MERFIDPKTLARVRDMPLIARTVAEGFLHGIQQSHQRGVGIEFSQYRAYEPGDDPGRIDWKLFSRSDRYFVREAERESEIAIWFVVDCSQSMAQQSESGAWSKFDYARHLAATLSYIAQRQGDLTGLVSLSSATQDILPLAAGERQWFRILRQLHTLRTGDRFPDVQQLATHMARLQVPGMVFVLSDFYQVSDEITDFMRRVSGSRAEIVAMQLQSSDELEFPYTGAIRFEDLESGEQALVSGRATRETYLQALDDYQSRLRQDMLRLNVSLHSINIDQPMDAALYSFLERRRRTVA